MRGRGGAWFRFVLWLAFLVIAVVGLHRLGSIFPVSAITDPGGPVEPALAAALRIIGLATGYWLGGSTLLYFVAQAARLPEALRAVRWLTLGRVRRLVDRLAVGALSVSLAMPASASATTTPGYVPVPAGDPPEATTSTTTSATETGPPIAVLPAADDHPPNPDPLYLPVVPIAEPEPAVRVVPELRTQAVEIVVRPGDNMWKLAEDRLSELLGRPPTDSEIAPFWLQVISANVSRIRSGDPDLIFPGEVLVIPPPAE